MTTPNRSPVEDRLTRTLAALAQTVPDEPPPFSVSQRPEPVLLAPRRRPLGRVAAVAAAAAVVVAGTVGVVALTRDGGSDSRIRLRPEPVAPATPSPSIADGTVEVPNVVGMVAADAFGTLSAAGFSVSTNGPADSTNTRVVQQSPAGRAQPGTEIVLTLGPG